jgi:hypothetical protein
VVSGKWLPNRSFRSQTILGQLFDKVILAMDRLSGKPASIVEKKYKKDPDLLFQLKDGKDWDKFYKQAKLLAKEFSKRKKLIKDLESSKYLDVCFSFVRKKGSPW